MLSQPVVDLSNRDLLALLVGEKTADDMLLITRGRLSELFASETCTVAMAREPGGLYGEWVEPRVILSAAREISRRCLGESLAKQGECMNSPQQVKAFLTHSLGHLPYEAFMALWLDAQHGLIEAEVLFKGTLTQTSVYPREVVRHAMAFNASTVIVAHNHTVWCGRGITGRPMVDRPAQGVTGLGGCARAGSCHRCRSQPPLVRRTWLVMTTSRPVSRRGLTLTH